jgi:putative sigma-54 modulation protein
MNLEIQGRDMKITEKLQQHAERKLARLDRYLPQIAVVRLELSHQHNRTTGEQAIAQLTIRSARGTILRTEVKDQPDMFAAIDMTVDKMYRQIERYKGKRRRHTGADFASAEPELADAEPSPIDFDSETELADGSAIVKRKETPVSAMSEDEAIDQMEMLGHAFFLFYNISTASVNVVYKRSNGGYGLLQPVLQ